MPTTAKPLMQRLLEMIRFSHTVFALPFALLACVWAYAAPFPFTGGLTLGQLVVRVLGVLLCMVSARSAAMAFNRLVDVNFDASNPRTAGRHLVSGELTRGQVWAFFSWMVLMFFLSCTLFLPNWLPLAGSLPVLVWICGYSLAKRFTAAAHVWLGIALALSPICAWIAMRGEVLLVDPADIWPAVGLAAAITCWVSGFDVIYACQDADFDQRAGLYSLPARLGIAGALRVAAGLHALMLAVLLALPGLFPQLSLGAIYYTGLAVVAVLVIRQHAIIRPRPIRGASTVDSPQASQSNSANAHVATGDAPRIDLGRVNEAFFQINALLSFCLTGAAAIDALWR